MVIIVMNMLNVLEMKLDPRPSPLVMIIATYVTISRGMIVRLIAMEIGADMQKSIIVATVH